MNGLAQKELLFARKGLMGARHFQVLQPLKSQVKYSRSIAP